MKTRMNVTKKEAEQICVWGEAICSESDYLMICDDGQMEFGIYSGSDDTKLSYENEYKDYEWRLTEIRDLKQGDVCMKHFSTIKRASWCICVFDKKYSAYFILDNRPLELLITYPIYKLFKKSDKK